MNNIRFDRKVPLLLFFLFLFVVGNVFAFVPSVHAAQTLTINTSPGPGVPRIIGPSTIRLNVNQATLDADGITGAVTASKFHITSGGLTASSATIITAGGTAVSDGVIELTFAGTPFSSTSSSYSGGGSGLYLDIGAINDGTNITPAIATGATDLTIYDFQVPTFTAVRTALNSIELTFSENVTSGGIDTDSFTVAGASAVSAGAVVANTHIILTTTGLTSTSSTPNVLYSTSTGDVRDTSPPQNEVADGVGAAASDSVAPNYQDSVYAVGGTVVGGATVTITAPSSIDAAETGATVYLAPTGTAVFVANGTTITSAAGTASSITAPTIAGDYKIFVKDALGNVSSESTATLTVSLSITHTATNDVKSGASNHVFSYTAPIEVPVGGHLYFGFPNTFSHVGMDTNNVYQDVDLLVNGVQRTLAATENTGVDGVLLVTPPSPGNVEYLLITLSTVISQGDTIELRVGTNASQGGAGVHQYSNPATAGSVNLGVGANSSDYGSTYFNTDKAFVIAEGVNAITVALGSANPAAKSVYKTFSFVPMLQFDVTSAAEAVLTNIKFTPTYSGTGGASDYGMYVVSDVDNSGTLTSGDDILTGMTPVTITAASGDQQSVAISGTLNAATTYHLLVFGSTVTSNPVAGDTFKISVRTSPADGIIVSSPVSAQSGEAIGLNLTLSNTAPSIAVTAPTLTSRYILNSEEDFLVQKLVFTNASSMFDTISGISLTPSGTIDERNGASGGDILHINFYLDANTNGTYEKLVDTSKAMSTQESFTADNTKQAFPFYGTTVPASSSLTLFAVYSLNGSSSNEETVIHSIAGGVADVSFGSGVSATAVDNAASATITIDSVAPSNENDVFDGTPSTVEVSGSLSINPSNTSGIGGLASDTVWIAPAGVHTIDYFVANGTTITSTTGSSSSITAPSVYGSYKVFITDLAGNISSSSTNTVTVETPAISFTAERTAANTIIVTFNQSVNTSSNNDSWGVSGCGNLPSISGQAGGGNGITTLTLTSSGITNPNDACTLTFSDTYGFIVKNSDGSTALADAAFTSVVDGIAPTYQDSVLTNNPSTSAGSAISYTAPSTIVGGDPLDTVFIAPAGTVSFVANGTTITSAIGTAFQMTSPTLAGTYKIFVVDPTGNASSATTNTITLLPALSVTHTATSTVKSVASNHTFSYTATASVPVGGNLFVGIPDSFTNVGMDTNNVYQDVDLIVNDVQRTLAAVADTGIDGVSILVDSGITYVLFDLNTGISEGDTVEIRVGTNASQGGAGVHQFTNASSAGSVNLLTGAVSADHGTTYYSKNDIAFVVTEPSVPTVILTDDSSTNFVKNTDIVHVTATFSEEMAATPTVSVDVSGGSSQDVTNIPMDAGIDALHWTYDWDVPPSSDTQTATVTVAGTSSLSVPYAGADTDVFTIDDTAPTTPTISFPTAAGIYLIGGSSQNITWTASTDTNFTATPITIEYSALGNFSDTSVWTSGTANDGSFTQTIPSSNVSTAKVRITATDKAGNTATSTSANAFTIDSINPAAPVIDLIATDDVINYSESITGGGVTVTGTKEAGSTVYISVGNPAVSESATTWSYLLTTSFITNDLGSGAFTLDVVYAADQAGNTSSYATARPFTVDLTVPSTPTASPVAGTFTSAQSVTLASTGSTSIRYSVSGETLSSCSSGTAYSSAISVSSTATITAKGCDAAGNISDLGTFAYTISVASGGGGGTPGGGTPANVLPVIATVPIITQPIVPPAIPIAPQIPVLPVTIFDPANFDALIAALGEPAKPADFAVVKPLVTADAKSFGVTLTPEQTRESANFMIYGISKETVKLGEGERRAVLRDYFQTVGKADVNWEDVQRLTTGQKPVQRNLEKEVAQAGIALNAFRKMTGHAPNFKDKGEDLAWNTMLYRIRFPRDLVVEQQGIVEYKKIFKKIPSTPFDWAGVRALGYALK